MDCRVGIVSLRLTRAGGLFTRDLFRASYTWTPIMPRLSLPLFCHSVYTQIGASLRENSFMLWGRKVGSFGIQFVVPPSTKLTEVSRGALRTFVSASTCKVVGFSG